MSPRRLWLVRQGLHLADYAPAFRALGLEVRELSRDELWPALERGPAPDLVLDSDLARTDFRQLTARGIPVAAVMLDHWYFSTRHKVTEAHVRACLALGIAPTRPTFLDANFRPRTRTQGPEDRLYVFPCAPEQAPVFAGFEGVRAAEPLLFGVDPERFRPMELAPEERARYACPVGFVGTSLINNPADGYRLIRDALDARPSAAGARLAVLLEEMVRLQTRDLFRWRIPQLMAELEQRHHAVFLTDGGLTPEKETWSILLGVHIAAVQRVAVARRLGPLGMAVWGSAEWAHLPGVDYRGEAAWATELAKVIGATEVNVNISKPMFPTGLAPRILEVLACGGFLLSNRLPAVEALFEDGKDLVYYDGLQDLEDKARHYLARPEERRRIADSGRRKVLAAHTWTHRARRILEVLEACGALPV